MIECGVNTGLGSSPRFIWGSIEWKEGRRVSKGTPKCPEGKLVEPNAAEDIKLIEKYLVVCRMRRRSLGRICMLTAWNRDSVYSFVCFGTMAKKVGSG